MRLTCGKSSVKHDMIRTASLGNKLAFDGLNEPITVRLSGKFDKSIFEKLQDVKRARRFLDKNVSVGCPGNEVGAPEGYSTRGWYR